MSGTYSQILLHAVFSTKERKTWLKPEIITDLYLYMGGIMRDMKGTLLAIGGVEDHVHLYFRWRTDEAISNLMREVKAGSSEWIHKHFSKLRAFAWQEGYSVFSVSKSCEKAVKKYIANQVEHHRRFDFRTELIELLEKHEISFEEKYLL
jgi:putative transposase